MTHVNPCGRAVDWIQFPFEVDARVHDGPGAPIVRLRWVYTPQPFLPVGTGCVILNRIWDEDQTSDLRVGQLPLVEANYEQDARWHLPAAIPDDHICHPEWLATGEPWPTDLPDSGAHAPYWIPDCCLLLAETEGGFELGGSVGDVFTIRDATAGGVSIGGSAGDTFRPPDATEGGVELGGASGDTFRPPDATEGGVEIGGEVGDVFSPVDGTEGGIEIGGEAGDEQTPALEAWIRDEAGDYTFTADFTGNHFIRCTGAGGRGGDATSGGGMDFSGGGGGGGAVAWKIVALVSGTDYDVRVGAGGTTGTPDGGDTFFKVGVVVTVRGAGGTGTNDQNGGAGGTTAGSIGTDRWPGGDGGDGNIDLQGCGGGSSAVYASPSDPPGDGLPGTIPDGGIAQNSEGGDGGDGGDSGDGGQPGFAPGGGGGGAGATATDPGGDGAAGVIKILWPS